LVDDALDGIQEGYEDVKAGHTQAADEMLKELRVKYGLPE
jgi:hypothetical protein